MKKNLLSKKEYEKLSKELEKDLSKKL